MTQKQREVVSFYYEEDMSLSEIASELCITRQAAHDLIKRSEKIVLDYENELKLVSRFKKQKKGLTQVKQMLLESKNDGDIKNVLLLIDELIEIY